MDLIRRGWLEMKGRAFLLLAASFIFFSTFLIYHWLFPLIFQPPPSFKFDSGNVIHLYSVVSLFLSPLPLFLSAVRVE